MDEEVFKNLYKEACPLVYIGKKFHRNGSNVYAQYDRYLRKMLLKMREAGQTRILLIVMHAHLRYAKNVMDELMNEYPDAKRNKSTG